MHNAKTDSSVGLDPLIKGMRDWKLHILFEQFCGRVVFELYLLAHVGSKHYTLAKYAKIKIIRTPFIVIMYFWQICYYNYKISWFIKYHKCLFGYQILSNSLS
jgi:hypothetical protein